MNCLFGCGDNVFHLHLLKEIMCISLLAGELHWHLIETNIPETLTIVGRRLWVNIHARCGNRYFCLEGFTKFVLHQLFVYIFAVCLCILFYLYISIIYIRIDCMHINPLIYLDAEFLIFTCDFSLFNNKKYHN